MADATTRRVGAILSANQDEVKFLGYGEYVGDEVVPAEVDEMMHTLGVGNPKIVLDNGDVVWGFQCWWGDEAKVKEMIGERTVTMVKVGES